MQMEVIRTLLKQKSNQKDAPPRNIGQMQSFLRLLNYYRAFVKEMRQVRSPLHKLLMKDVPFYWSSECQQTFNRTKEVLLLDMLLTNYDHSKGIVVSADVSECDI